MIFVSAGHFPSKPGAGWNDFYEHDEAVRWRELIFEALFNSSDEDIAFTVPTGTLKEKVEFIKNRSGERDLAIEIHFNAARDTNNNPIGQGCETLYMPGSEDSETFARYVQAAMSIYFHPDRGTKEGWYRMDKRRGPDFFLARTPCPAIIIEPDFIHRREQIESNREVCCPHIAMAILEAQKEIYDVA